MNLKLIFAVKIYFEIKKFEKKIRKKNWMKKIFRGHRVSCQWQLVMHYVSGIRELFKKKKFSLCQASCIHNRVHKVWIQVIYLSPPYDHSPCLFYTLLTFTSKRSLFPKRKTFSLPLYKLRKKFQGKFLLIIWNEGKEVWAFDMTMVRK